MTIPTNTRQRLNERFDLLIAEGMELVAKAEPLDGYGEPSGHERVATARYAEWSAKTATLLGHVFAAGNAHRNTANSLPQDSSITANIEMGIGLLKATKSDLEAGLLDALSTRIEAEVACGYLGRAESLLGEGQPGKHGHVPAAVRY